MSFIARQTVYKVWPISPINLTYLSTTFVLLSSTTVFRDRPPSVVSDPLKLEDCMEDSRASGPQPATDVNIHNGRCGRDSRRAPGEDLRSDC